METIILLLKAALLLLLTVQAHPELPQSYRDQANNTATYAITLAQSILLAPTGSVGTTTDEISTSTVQISPVQVLPPLPPIELKVTTMPEPIKEEPKKENILTVKITPVSHPSPTNKTAMTIFETSDIPSGVVSNPDFFVQFNNTDFERPEMITLYGENLVGGTLPPKSDGRNLRGNVVFDYSAARVLRETTVTITIKSAETKCNKEYTSCVFPTFPIVTTLTLIP